MERHGTKFLLLGFLIFLPLLGNAQIPLGYGFSLSLGGSAYTPNLSIYRAGLSPQLGVFAQKSLLDERLHLRFGANLTRTQLRRPHLSAGFTYLGIPGSVLYTFKPTTSQSNWNPIVLARYQASWQLRNPNIIAGTSTAQNAAALYRGEWSLGLGLGWKQGKYEHEFILSGGISSALNDNFSSGRDIQALKGTRISIEWNLIK